MSMNHHTPKILATFGLAGEIVAWAQSQPVLGFISFVGTAATAVSAWYWSEKGRKRRDRREEHLENAFEDIVKALKTRIATDIRSGKDDPFPELTKLLIEMGRDDDAK